jgi:hypothetical protein
MKRSLMLSLSVAIVLLVCVCCHICVFAEEEIGIPDFGNGLTAEGASWYSNDAIFAFLEYSMKEYNSYRISCSKAFAGKNQAYNLPVSVDFFILLTPSYNIIQ